MDEANNVSQSDSAYTVSTTGESSSSSRQEASSSRAEGSKKRKIKEDSTVLHGRLKRFKESYNDQYRKLFNEILIDSSQGLPEETESPVSQHGVSLWSSEEKDIFFCSLARRGRHDVRGIANDIGSKSESEVYLYLEKLQKAADNEQIYSTSKQLPKTFDIPAAFEINPDCCRSLDTAAESLSVLQQQEEERLEKKKHGAFSLLTPRIANWAKRCMRSGDEGRNELLETLPTAELLNLKTLLTLSKRFFMNSSIMENNWRTYTERRKSPTITYTAFSDFHTLALSISRRIVQSSIFFAMSRRRALDASGGYKCGPYVKRLDVIAATNVLNLETSVGRLWTGVARKCNLRVYENLKHRQGSGKRYSYDEVEAVLTAPPKRRGRSRAASQESDKSSDAEPERMQDSGQSNKPDLSDSSGSSDSFSKSDEEPNDPPNKDLSPNSTNDVSKPKTRESLEEARDAYAEAIDRRASRAEEARLWELLGENPAQKMMLETPELPKKPIAQRKDEDDLTYWKSWVNYTAEWETYETPIPASSFAENQTLGRRSRGATGLSDSGSESENVEDGSRSNPKSTRRSSSRKTPMSEEFVRDESSSDGQSEGTEERIFFVGREDDDSDRESDEEGGASVDDGADEVEDSSS